AFDAAVHRREIDPCRPAVDLHAEIGGAVQLDADAGGGDEGLRRHAVVEHARPTHAIALDDGDLGTVLRCDERRFVARRTSTHDHDSGHACPSSWLPGGF